jgi:hypothetical protein
MRATEFITESYQLDEGLGDWIEKKMNDLLGSNVDRSTSPDNVARYRSKAPVDIPDDVAQQLVAQFLAKRENEALLAQAAEAQKTTAEKIKPFLMYFVGEFVDRWQRISRADKSRVLKDLAMSVFRLILFILQAMLKGKR